jgi:hypothetical protein
MRVNDGRVKIGGDEKQNLKMRLISDLVST